MQMMQQQLANMPASQRAMAEQMMKSVMGTVRPPLTYVWSTEKKRIAGYECTRVDGMRGDDKVTEYCGSTSADFRMSDAEHKTMLAMQSYLRNFTIMVQTADDGTRAFQWDTNTDGYPVLSRCYSNGTMTVDLALQSVTHQRIPDELFDLPRGYRKTDSDGDGRLGARIAAPGRLQPADREHRHVVGESRRAAERGRVPHTRVDDRLWPPVRRRRPNGQAVDSISVPGRILRLG